MKRSFSRRDLRLAGGVLVLLLAGCGTSSGAAASDSASAPKAQSGNSGAPSMNAKTNCGTDNFSRSQCMIRLILDDLQKTAGGEAGGGITEIKANSSTSYTASWSKEERVEKYTYEFAFDADNNASVKARTVATEHRGH